jgi:hypothetical protein
MLVKQLITHHGGAKFEGLVDTSYDYLKSLMLYAKSEDSYAKFALRLLQVESSF